jgi:predicted DsbA family dithiol-disulfide isomerase
MSRIARSCSRLDADVTLAGKRVDLLFDYEQISITPNTRLAHRLMFLAQQKGDAEKTDELFEAIFSKSSRRSPPITTPRWIPTPPAKRQGFR